MSFGWSLHRAVKDLNGFSDAVCAKIVRALQVLHENPLPRGKTVKKIRATNADYYRLRADKYRVFYMIEGRCVIVLHILHKKRCRPLYQEPELKIAILRNGCG